MGNGEPGAMGSCSATAGGLRLGSLGLSRVTPWARRVLWHATATINSSGASGNNGYGPTRLAEPSIASTLGTAVTLRSTALARDDGSWKKLTDRRGPCLCVVVVRARTRLMSVYPCGDRSRGQFFVDEEVLNFEIDSEHLASSCRCRAHGTLVVPAIVARRTPRLMTSLGNDALLVDEEGYPYLVRRIELLVVSRRSPLALERCRRR
jgi:hypothetical protein